MNVDGGVERFCGTEHFLEQQQLFSFYALWQMVFERIFKIELNLYLSQFDFYYTSLNTITLTSNVFLTTKQTYNNIMVMNLNFDEFE